MVEEKTDMEGAFFYGKPRTSFPMSAPLLSAYRRNEEIIRLNKVSCQGRNEEMSGLVALCWLAPLSWQVPETVSNASRSPVSIPTTPRRFHFAESSCGGKVAAACLAASP